MRIFWFAARPSGGERMPAFPRDDGRPLLIPNPAPEQTQQDQQTATEQSG